MTNETGAMVKKVSDTEYEGVKLQGTFCYNPQAVFPIYFVMRVSKKPTEAGYWKKQRPMTGVEAEWDVDMVSISSISPITRNSLVMISVYG